MRNYDMVGGVVRRYVGEYIQNPHDFIVGANNPEVVLARDAKLRQELMTIVQQKIAERIKQIMNNLFNKVDNLNNLILKITLMSKLL